MATLSQSIGPLLKQVQYEQSQLATQPLPLQSHYLNHNPTFTNPTFTHPTFTHPTIEQPPLNSQYIYQPKKAGIVNEIINSINKQHEKLLKGITLSQNNMYKINSRYKQILRDSDRIIKLEERLKTYYCDLEKK
eukprot:280556_1